MSERAVLNNALGATRLLISAMLLVCTVSEALSDLLVQVDISQQSMTVGRDGKKNFIWPVSTGSDDFRTPTGSYQPIRMHETWFSRKYDGVPMPNSIFFYGGYAIHGTLDIKNLGRPTSHGCVRLHTENAKVLFDLVKKQGLSRTKIIIQK